MKSLSGFGVFLGLAAVIACLRWPSDPRFAQDGPAEAILFAALLTPFVATWVMPTWFSLLAYPFAVAGAYVSAGALGQVFLAEPTGETGYGCGLPAAMMFLAGLAGVATGLIGRAIGLAFLGRASSGVATYFLQLTPMLLLVFVLHVSLVLAIIEAFTNTHPRIRGTRSPGPINPSVRGYGSRTECCAFIREWVGWMSH